MNLSLARVLECDEQLEKIVEIVLNHKKWGEILNEHSLCDLAFTFLEGKELLSSYVELLDIRKNPPWLSVRVLSKLIEAKSRNPFGH